MAVNKVVFGAVAIMDISDSTVSADKLAKGITAYDKTGEKITGTHECDVADLQEKTITPTTNQQNIVADSGYDGLSKVTVLPMPTATQATPSISVSSSGLITASTTQTAGYVANGTKSATKQLTTQGAKTITPSTSSQTAVASGRYTTGTVTVGAIPSSYVQPTSTKGATTYTPSRSDQTIASGTYCSGVQTIKGDSNLLAVNIKNGVTIFGVTGKYEGEDSGSGDEDGPSGGDGPIGELKTCLVTININVEDLLAPPMPGEEVSIIYSLNYTNSSGNYVFTEETCTTNKTIRIGVLRNSIMLIKCNLGSHTYINGNNANWGPTNVLMAMVPGTDIVDDNIKHQFAYLVQTTATIDINYEM